jgi:hypothetical protein
MCRNSKIPNHLPISAAGAFDGESEIDIALKAIGSKARINPHIAAHHRVG